MRRIMTSSIFILSLVIGSGVAFADNHGNGRSKGNDHRIERNNHDFTKNKKSDKHYNKGKNNKPIPVPGHSHGYAPAYQGHGHVATPPPPPHPRLNGMLKKVTKGCRDVDVWQVDYDTYVVRYRKGNRLYTRYIYPERGAYGRPNLISVNWTPMAPWNLLPPIQLNINL